MADPNVIRETIDQYCAAFTANDREAWLATFTDDATLEDPVGSPVRKGRDEIGEFFTQMWTLANSITIGLTAPAIICGSEAAIPMKASSVVGDSTFEMDIVDVMTFADDGRITSQRAFVDFGAARQV